MKWSDFMQCSIPNFTPAETADSDYRMELLPSRPSTLALWLEGNCRNLVFKTREANKGASDHTLVFSLQDCQGHPVHVL